MIKSLNGKEAWNKLLCWEESLRNLQSGIHKNRIKSRNEEIWYDAGKEATYKDTGSFSTVGADAYPDEKEP